MSDMLQLVVLKGYEEPGTDKFHGWFCSIATSWKKSYRTFNDKLKRLLQKSTN